MDCLGPGQGSVVHHQGDYGGAGPLAATSLWDSEPGNAGGTLSRTLAASTGQPRNKLGELSCHRVP